jgi:hypothetical protein
MNAVSAYSNPGTVETAIVDGKYEVTKYSANDGSKAGGHTFLSRVNASNYLRNLVELHCYVLTTDAAQLGSAQS